jgi:hypothetical protein
MSVRIPKEKGVCIHHVKADHAGDLNAETAQMLDRFEI